MNDIKNLLFLFALFFIVVNIPAGTTNIDILDREYLTNTKYIKIDSFDTLASFIGQRPQLYYINLFTSLLIMGINGYTNYEILPDDITINPDLILKCQLVNLNSKRKKKTRKIKYNPNQYTIKISGVNPANNKVIFKTLRAKITFQKNCEDVFKEGIIDIAMTYLKFLYTQRKEMLIKTFYLNKIKCDNLVDKKISYVFLSDREEPFLDKFIDVVEAELQQYLYDNKIMIMKLNKTNDSLIHANQTNLKLTKNDNAFSPNLHGQLIKSNLDYLILISDMTSFKKEKLPKHISNYEKNNFSWLTPLTFSSLPGSYTPLTSIISKLPIYREEPLANMEEMNKYERVFCNMNIIDIRNNTLIFRNQLFLMEDAKCKNPAVCLARKLIAEIGQYDPSTNTISSCSLNKKSKKRRRKRN